MQLRIEWQSMLFTILTLSKRSTCLVIPSYSRARPQSSSTSKSSEMLSRFLPRQSHIHPQNARSSLSSVRVRGPYASTLSTPGSANCGAGAGNPAHCNQIPSCVPSSTWRRQHAAVHCPSMSKTPSTPGEGQRIANFQKACNPRPLHRSRASSNKACPSSPHKLISSTCKQILSCCEHTPATNCRCPR